MGCVCVEGGGGGGGRGKGMFHFGQELWPLINMKIANIMFSLNNLV